MKPAEGLREATVSPYEDGNIDLSLLPEFAPPNSLQLVSIVEHLHDKLERVEAQSAELAKQNGQETQGRQY